MIQKFCLVSFYIPQVVYFQTFFKQNHTQKNWFSLLFLKIILSKTHLCTDSLLQCSNRKVHVGGHFYPSTCFSLTFFVRNLLPRLPLSSPTPNFFICHLVKGRLSFIITRRFVILKINGSLCAGLKYACFF